MTTKTTTIKSKLEEVINKSCQYLQLQKEWRESDEKKRQFSDFLARESTDASLTLDYQENEVLLVKRNNSSKVELMDTGNINWILSETEMNTISLKNEDSNILALKAEIAQQANFNEKKNKSMQQLNNLIEYIIKHFGDKKATFLFLFFFLQFLATCYLIVFLSLKAHEMKDWVTYVQYRQEDRIYFLDPSKDVKEIDLKQCTYTIHKQQAQSPYNQKEHFTNITEQKGLISAILIFYFIFKGPYLLFKARIVYMILRKCSLDVFTMYDSTYLDFFNLNIDLALVLGYSPLFQLQFLSTGCLYFDLGFDFQMNDIMSLYTFFAGIGITTYILIFLTFYVNTSNGQVIKPFKHLFTFYQFIILYKILCKWCWRILKKDIENDGICLRIIFAIVYTGFSTSCIFTHIVLEIFTYPFVFYYAPSTYLIYWYIYFFSTLICLYITKNGVHVKEQIEYMTEMTNYIKNIQYLDESWGSSVRKLILLRNSQNWNTCNYSIKLYKEKEQNLSYASLYSTANVLKSNILSICSSLKKETVINFQREQQPQINTNPITQTELIKTQSQLPLLVSKQSAFNNNNNNPIKEIYSVTQNDEDDRQKQLQVLSQKDFDNQSNHSIKQNQQQSKQIDDEEINIEFNEDFKTKAEDLDNADESNNHQIRKSFQFL